MQRSEVFILIGSYEEPGRTIMVFYHKVVNPQFNIEDVGQLYQCLMHFKAIDNPSTVCIVWTFFQGNCAFLVPTDGGEMNTNPSLITIIAHKERRIDAKFSREELLQQYKASMTMERKLKHMFIALFNLKTNGWSIDTPSIDAFDFYGSSEVLEKATVEDMGRIYFYETHKSFK